MLGLILGEMTPAMRLGHRLSLSIDRILSFMTNDTWKNRGNTLAIFCFDVTLYPPRMI